MTLNQISLKGLNNILSMPPYRFEYASNPPWGGVNKWSRWGSYLSIYDTGHQTPQNAITAAQNAYAWNLTKINTPTGGTIEIEYESDTYSQVNGVSDFNQVKSVGAYVIPEGEMANAISLNGVAPPGVVPGDYVLVRQDWDASNYYWKSDLRKVVAINNSRDVITVDHDIRGTGDGLWAHVQFPSKEIFGGGHRVRSITTSDGASRYVTEYDYDYSAKHSSGTTPSLPPLYGQAVGDYKGRMTLKSWLYTDDHSNYFGPATYCTNPVQLNPSEQECRYRDVMLQYENAYINRSVGRPAPGVIYGQVTVKDVVSWNRDDKKGHTVYEHFTSTDYPYSAEERDDGHDDASGLILEDRSAIYGHLKRMTVRERLPGVPEEYRTVSQESRSYAFGGELMNEGRVVKEAGAEEWEVITENGDEVRALGRITQVHDYRYQAEEDDPIDHGFVVRRHHQVYPISSISTAEFYDHPSATTSSGSATTEEKSFMWDMRSGHALATASEGHSGRTVVSLKYPAYWRYEGMRDKNMLDQLVQTTKYASTSLDISSPSSLKAYSFPASEAIESAFTLWSNGYDLDGDGTVDADTWLKQSEFVYDRSYTLAPFPSPLPFAIVGGGFEPPSASFPWQQTSEVTRYDTYSRTIETMGADGNRAVTLYGKTHQLPKAVVTNAHLDEVVFASYGEDESRRGWTHRNNWCSDPNGEAYPIGSSGITLDHPDAIGAVRVPSEEPEVGGGYTVELWVAPTKGDLMTLRVSGDEVTAVGVGNVTWANYQLLRLENVALGWDVVLEYEDTDPMDHACGDGTELQPRYGALRLYPTRAQMSTFTYEPLLRKVSSISNERNVASYYAYDSAGRLVRVENQRGHFVSRHAYHYGSPEGGVGSQSGYGGNELYRQGFITMDEPPGAHQPIQILFARREGSSTFEVNVLGGDAPYAYTLYRRSSGAGVLKDPDTWDKVGGPITASTPDPTFNFGGSGTLKLVVEDASGQRGVAIQTIAP